METSWIRPVGRDVMVAAHLVPRAAEDAVQGLHGDALKIRLKAPPVDGKANEALIKFIAGKLQLPRGNVYLKSGFNQRRKIVGVSGLSVAEVQKRLLNSKEPQ